MAALTAELQIYFEIQKREAFRTLLAALKDLFYGQSDEVEASVLQSRTDLEQVILAMAPGIRQTPTLMQKVIKSSSLTVLKGLMEGPQAEGWRRAFQDLHQSAEGDGVIYDSFTGYAASTELILYLRDHGFPLHRAGSAMTSRILTEESTVLDPILADIFPKAPDPFVEALRGLCPLDTMKPGHGLRHLYRIEELLQSKDGQIEEVLLDIADHAVRRCNWHTMSLLLWLGWDMSAHARDVPDLIAPLFVLSASRHGRLKLREIEPCIESLAGRDKEAERFQITPDAVKAANQRRPSSSTRTAGF